MYGITSQYLPVREIVSAIWHTLLPNVEFVYGLCACCQCHLIVFRLLFICTYVHF